MRSIYIIILLTCLSTSAFGWKKDKKTQAAVPQQEQRLSDDDMLRYRYFYLEALRYNGAEKFTEAYELFRHCLQINPNASETHFALAPFEAAFGRDSLAQAHYETALRLDPDNDEFAERLAQYYLSREDKAKGEGKQDYMLMAANVYEDLAKRYPDRSDYMEILSKIYLNQKDYRKMLSALNRLEVLEGQSEDLTLTKMQVYSYMGEQEGAHEELVRLVKNHPNDLSYRVMLGNWLLGNGRKDEAQKEYLAVLKEEPDNAPAQMSLMDYYRTVGDTAEADKLLYAILQNPRTESDTRITLMREVVQDNEKAGGDSTRVLNIFNRVLSFPQQTSEMAEMKVAYLQLKGMPKDSIKAALNKVLDISPENIQARLQLIDILWRDTIDQNVVNECEQAIAYNPDEMALYYYLGLARYLNQDDKGALEAFRNGAMRIDDETPADMASKVYMFMGDILHGMGQKKEAYMAYDSCLVYNPDQIECLNNYAYFLSTENRDLKRAEQMSYKTIKAEPDNATFLDTYAWILYKEERYEEARIYIDQVMKADPDNVTGVLNDHAGDIYIKLGFTAEAVEFWKKALEYDTVNADEIRKKITLANKKKK